MTEQERIAFLTEKVIDGVRGVYDPEIPVNIYDLGLVYKIQPLLRGAEKPDLLIEMTLTTAHCPLADAIPAMVHDSLAKLGEFNDIDIQLVWEPPWDPGRMSEEARLALDMF